MADQELPAGNQPFVFTYFNHRGESAVRKVDPIRFYWGHTFYYPENQWLLEALDLDRGEVRAFAVEYIVPGDISQQIDDYVRAIVTANPHGEKPNEPFRSIGLAIRRLTKQLHERAARLDETLIKNVELRTRTERLDAENRTLRAATHEIDVLTNRVDDLNALNADLRSQLAAATVALANA